MSDERPWHTVDPSDLEAGLGTGLKGLSADEAARRLERDGPNVLEEAPRTSVVAAVLNQFKSPLISILLVAAVVTLALGHLIDTGVIAAVLVLNAVIGFTQEWRAESSVRALMGLVAPQAHVVRDGQEWEIPSAELVRGDLVLLESGVRVPADLRLTSATALEVDESLLTGESVPVWKQTEMLAESTPLADRTNIAHTGTVVTSGRGRGYAIATGTDTELGAIAESIRTEEEPPTPLQLRMTRLAHVIAAAILAGSMASFVIGVLIGESPAVMFLVAVALAVAAIPEGLPVVFTITLALGVRRMARRNAIVRRLPAVETLGSTTVIGSDKTGTLTENRMTVRKIWTPVGLLDVEDSRVDVPDAARLTLLAGVLTNEADLYRTPDGFRTSGDPTEAALLVAAARMGIEPEEVREDHPVVAEIPFEPERRYSASIRTHDGRHLVFVKGAPERLLEMSHMMLSDGGPVELDAELVHGAARGLASEGLRVLAMAYHQTDPPDDQTQVSEPGGLIFCGLMGMLDPPRAGVADAVRGCREAGIRVMMITGDHALTARSIASELGIASPDAAVLTGQELESIDDDQLAERVATIPVYARVAPEHKLRVVRALQKRGDVVAVTGDGVNDAPALKAADIGVAMGRSGTDVAREASDMVLADDNFVSIYAAVEEGRVTFDNVRKVTFFLLSTGAASIVAILTALGLGWPLLMLPAQLLWLNLVTNGLQDVALAFEPGEQGVLKRPPRSKREGVLSRLLWERTALAGVVMAAGTLHMFRWELDRTGSEPTARTVALTTMVIFMAFHAGMARSEHRSAFAINPFSNRFLFVAVAAALSLHAGALYLPATQFVLRVEPLEVEAWVRMVVVALSVIAAMELHKLVRRRHAP